MVTLITIVHIIVCFFIIIVVLLQSGKSGDIAAAFGGMGSQTAFGPRGAASALSKATTWSAVIFMVTSITLSIVVARRPAANSVFRVSSRTKRNRSPQRQLRSRQHRRRNSSQRSAFSSQFSKSLTLEAFPFAKRRRSRHRS